MEGAFQALTLQQLAPEPGVIVRKSLSPVHDAEASLHVAQCLAITLYFSGKPSRVVASMPVRTWSSRWPRRFTSRAISFGSADPKCSIMSVIGIACFRAWWLRGLPI